jgi:hypothetical protein
VSAKIDFLVVGAFAAIELGVPRYTGDLDFWIRRTPENAQKIVDVLNDFGFGSLGLQASDFLEDGVMIQLGRAPSRLDILNFLTALDFEGAWARRRAGQLDGIEVSFLARDDLIANKKALGRPKDLFDIQQLEDLE